jgi:hypothetical protein
LLIQIYGRVLCSHMLYVAIVNQATTPLLSPITYPLLIQRDITRNKKLVFRYKKTSIIHIC